MASKKGRSAEPYGFDARMEKVIAYYASTSPSFWSRTLHAIDPSLMEYEPARKVLEAARAIANDLGHGPDDIRVVTQRLARWTNDGRITRDEREGIFEMLDGTSFNPPPEDSVEAEIVPVIQGKMRIEAALAATSAISKNEGMERTSEIIEKAQALGKSTENIGTSFGAEAFESIRRAKMATRIPTGIQELDEKLDGGLINKGLGVAVAGPGGGKSIFLSHLCAYLMSQGHFVAYATLEIPESLVHARIIANLTGVPIKGVMNGSLEIAQRKLFDMALEGDVQVADFPAKATTVRDLKQWVHKIQDKKRRKLTCLFVDYGDKLVAKVSNDTNNEYRDMGTVFEGMRVKLAVEEEMGVWTASQSRAREERKAGTKKIDIEHIADSMHKVRIADLLVTLNYNEDQHTLGLFTAKHRVGESRHMCGPFAVDWATGRITPEGDVSTKGPPLKRPEEVEEPGANG